MFPLECARAALPQASPAMVERTSRMNTELHREIPRRTPYQLGLACGSVVRDGAKKRLHFAITSIGTMIVLGGIQALLSQAW